MRTTLLAVVTAIVLSSAMIAPAAAAPAGEHADSCQNADRGPGDGNPPGFVADLTPDFLSDLIGRLPVPNFVKSLFGADAC